MTPKDKPKRPGAKPFGRDKKPYSGMGKPADGKPRDKMKALGGKSAGAKSADAKPYTGSKPAAEPAAAATAGGMVPERISKILARVGVASRRDIERMIMEGRVSLNGKVLDTPVVNATLDDKIEVDGQPIRGIERTRLWLYHKPAGLVTTNSDPEGRPTVFERLPEELPRVLSVGRLDINTEGLLLLTNDGGLSRVLELPKTGWLRRYRVRAHGKIEQADLDKLKDGIAVEGVLYGGIEATLDKVQGSNVWITMGLREGKNREIKNVLGALGLDVNRLIRISYGPFQLGELPEGQVQEIRGRTLRDQLGPRLIEEAKANFDAPIYSNAVEEDEAPAPKGDWSAKAEKPARGFRDKPEDRRERALGRLDTKRDERRGDDRFDRPKREGGRDAGGKSGGRFEDEKPFRQPAQRARTANVWMAPGARPVAEKKPKVEGEIAEKPLRRERPEGAPKTKRYGRTKDGQPVKSTKRFDPDRKGAKPFQRPDSGPRVVVNHAEDGKEWIRSSEIVRDEKNDRSGGGRPGGDRKPRDFADRPRGDRPDRGDRPARAEGDRPPRRDGDRPFGDKPRGKSFGGKPGGSKPFGAKPSGDRSGGKGPNKGPGKGPDRGPSKGPNKGMTRGADRRR